MSPSGERFDDVLRRAGVSARRRRRAARQFTAGGAAREAGTARPRGWVLWLVGALVSSVASTWLTIVAWARAGASLGGGAAASAVTFGGWLVLAGLATGLTTWLTGVASRELSAAVRRRQLRGIATTLTSSAGHARARGLSEILDLEQVELVAVTMLGAAILGGIDAAVGAVILVREAPGRSSALLIGAAILTAGVVAVLARHAARTVEGREALTARLLDRVAGFRTYSIYGDHEGDHVEDQGLLRRYLRAAVIADVARASLSWLLPSLVLLIGVVVVIKADDSAGTRGAILGSLLFLSRGLEQLAAGVGEATASLPALRKGLPLLRARQKETTIPSPTVSGVLAEVGTLSIRSGDRILLTGETATGKSRTLKRIVGEIADERGSARRADRARIALLSHTSPVDTLHQSVAFNVLVGGRWPADTEALDGAEDLLVRYGLGPLLEAMPQGLAQPIGETGWRLSQGEHARLGLVRALATKPDLLLIDGSLEALDPASRLRVMDELAREPLAVVVTGWPPTE